MGGRSLRNQNGVVDPTTQFNIYAPKYFHSVAPIGDEQMLGDLMGRIACSFGRTSSFSVDICR